MATNAGTEVITSPPILLRDLRNALAPVEAKWRQLGVQFGFTENELDAIQNGHSGEGVSQWLNSMLNDKLNNYPEFSWGDVVVALEAVGHRSLAADLKHAHYSADITSHPRESRGLSDLRQENMARLNDEFGALLDEVSTHLENIEVNPERFCLYVKGAFPPAHFISDNDSIRTMFAKLTDKGRWNCLHYRPLLRLVNRYDKTNMLINSCRQYEGSVTHFKFVEHLSDWVRKRESDIRMIPLQPHKMLPGEYCQLSAKIHVKVTEKTLGFVTELWEYLADTAFGLPDLAAVLYDIKTGCLLVTWLLPNVPEILETIVYNSSKHKSAFDRRGILYCLLDKHCLYSQEMLSTAEEYDEETEQSIRAPLLSANSETSVDVRGLRRHHVSSKYAQRRRWPQAKSAKPIYYADSQASSVNQSSLPNVASVSSPLHEDKDSPVEQSAGERRDDDCCSCHCTIL